jgi:ABC-type Zn uptake system ZnuABC Zn-binding protein ZnuA
MELAARQVEGGIREEGLIEDSRPGGMTWRGGSRGAAARQAPFFIKGDKMFRGMASARGAWLGAIAVLCLLAAGGGLGCGGTAGNSGQGITVACDIYPLYDFCRNVAGDKVEVQAMVPPGSSPHLYEPTSAQIKYLSEADILVINGLGLTPWAEDIFNKVENPRLVKVVAGESVPQGELLPAAGAGDEVEGGAGVHGETVYDPHVWLDPNLAVYMVESIRDALIEVDPGNRAVYEGSAERYIAELRSLDGELKTAVGRFSGTAFVSFHSSWTYFAARYGLNQVAVIEELPGKEPSAGWIAELVKLIRENEVKAIFVEPQLNPRPAEAVAEEAGPGVALLTLDPLGDPRDPEKSTYIGMMRYNLAEMSEALR